MVEAFKTEIIEAERNRTDLLKWKLIIVAALIAVGFGIDSGDSTLVNIRVYPELALTLIPAVATYVDLLCIHLQFRILVISKFFQNYNSNPSNEEMLCFIAYEKFCADVRVRSMFGLEDLAQVGSTITLSILVIIFSVFTQPYNFYLFIISGIMGIITSICLFYFYKQKLKKLDNILT